VTLRTAFGVERTGVDVALRDRFACRGRAARQQGPVTGEEKEEKPEGEREILHPVFHVLEKTPLI
jgi:hypothetical protein